jgi:hypothetical protein
MTSGPNETGDTGDSGFNLQDAITGILGGGGGRETGPVFLVDGRPRYTGYEWALLLTNQARVEYADDLDPASKLRADQQLDAARSQFRLLSDSEQARAVQRLVQMQTVPGAEMVGETVQGEDGLPAYDTQAPDIGFTADQILYTMFTIDRPEDELRDTTTSEVGRRDSALDALQYIELRDRLKEFGMTATMAEAYIDKWAYQRPDYAIVSDFLSNQEFMNGITRRLGGWGGLPNAYYVDPGDGSDPVYWINMDTKGPQPVESSMVNRTWINDNLFIDPAAAAAAARGNAMNEQGIRPPWEPPRDTGLGRITDQAEVAFLQRTLGSLKPRDQVAPTFTPEEIAYFRAMSLFGPSGGGGGGGSRMTFDDAAIRETISQVWGTLMVEDVPDLDGMLNAYKREARAQSRSLSVEAWTMERMRETPRYQVLYGNKPPGLTEEDYFSRYRQRATAFGFRPDFERQQIEKGLTTGVAPESFEQALEGSRQARRLYQGDFSRRFARKVAEMGLR